MAMNDTTKPLLLIDVDGPLNPYDAPSHRRPEGYSTHRMMPDSWRASGRRKPLRVWLKHAMGEDLLALPFELVWCTTWEHEANEWIGPHLGLPELPYVEFDKTWALPTRPDGTYFKTHEVVEYAAGRPFAWVDDEITTWDEDYIKAHHPGPARLLWITPAAGLRQPDFDKLKEWAASLEAVEP